MNNPPDGVPQEKMTTADWASSRGGKWSAQLSGMEAMMAPVDAPLLRALALDRPYRIADVGCGGGGTALEILRHAPPGSVVHGFDISSDLIELARARSESAGPSIAFEVANMATTPAPPERYDRLVSRFGVMFFDDPPAAFRNLAGWLAPGGRFAFAVWGPLAENPWMSVVREVVAGIVELPPPKPDAPGPFRYADAGRPVALLQAAGCVDLQVEEWRGVLPIGGGLAAEEAANFALSAFSSFGELLAAAGGDAYRNARQSLTERFSVHEKEGAVQMDASVHLVTGRSG